VAPRAWESAPFPIGLAARAGLDTVPRMCRNIRTLANFAPPATAAEIRASSLQFVRKLSGANTPSKANAALFERAVDEVASAAERLVHGWVTSAPPKDRDVEIRKMIERSRARFGKEPKRTPIDPIR